MAKKGLRAEFEGQKELLENMKNLATELQTKVKLEAVMEAANFLKGESERRVPIRTGKLKENIVIQKVEDNEIATEVKVGPNRDAFYGAMVEYGTKNMRARPFMRPSFDENEDRIQKEITRKIQEGIERAVRHFDPG